MNCENSISYIILSLKKCAFIDIDFIVLSSISYNYFFFNIFTLSFIYECHISDIKKTLYVFHNTLKTINIDKKYKYNSLKSFSLDFCHVIYVIKVSNGIKLTLLLSLKRKIYMTITLSFVLFLKEPNIT